MGHRQSKKPHPETLPRADASQTSPQDLPGVEVSSLRTQILSNPSTCSWAKLHLSESQHKSLFDFKAQVTMHLPLPL